MSHSWKELNAEGLALASQGQWADATRVFEDALAVIDGPDDNSAVTTAAKDDIRARLMLNIGQSYFHLGSFDQSRRFAERSCALRVGLYGEDSLIVARTRGDLAVILGASGHGDEAISLLERAVSAVERKRGAESAHLLPLLTNAARLLLRTAPDRAQPFVARLKALSFAQQLADMAEIFPPSEIPAHSFDSADQSLGNDDHLLRSAIAQTVDLLRSTPTANVAMASNAVSTITTESVELESAAIDHVNIEPLVVDQLDVEEIVAEPNDVEPVVIDQLDVEQIIAEPSDIEPVVIDQLDLEQIVAEPSDVEPVVTDQLDVEQIVAEPTDVEHDLTSEAAIIEPVVAQLDLIESARIESPDPHDITQEIFPNDIMVTPEQLLTALPDLQLNDAEKDAAVEVAWEYEVPPSVTPQERTTVRGAEQLDDAMFDLVEPPPPTLNSIPVPTAASAKGTPNPLGFEVQYGIPSQLHESLANPTTPLSTEAEPRGPGSGNDQGPQNTRTGMRAVGGVRRGSTQVVAMNRLWIIGAYVAAFGGGIGAYLLYRYLAQ